MDLSHGGHLTHGMAKNVSGRLYDVVAYHVRPEQGVVSILLLGFIAAVALGAYVAWSILRSGRP